MVAGISIVGIAAYNNDSDQPSSQSPTFVIKQVLPSPGYNPKRVQKTSQSDCSDCSPCSILTNLTIYTSNNTTINIKDQNGNYKIDPEDTLTLKSGELPKYDHLEKILRFAKTRSNKSECTKGDYQSISVTYYTDA